MFYESNITVLPNGEATVITTGSDWKRGENYLTSLHEETTYQYSSVEALRKAITREKFSTETHRIIGCLKFGSGLALGVASLLNANLFLKEAQVAVSLFALYTGLNAWKEGQGDKPKVDSIIKAFNRDLPNLKPIPLNIRDYLAKRIPFLQK